MPISDLLGDLPSDSTLLTSARMIKHMRKDGSVISVHIQSTPLETDGRKLRVITVIDAGHQAEIAKSLTRVQEDFANAFETAPVSMALVATDDVISMVNDSFVRLVGYDREDVENSLLSSYIDEQDNERLRAKLATLVFGDAKSVRREVRIIRKDETKIRVLFSGTLVRDERGRPVHLIAQLLEVFEGPGALASASEI
jgi:PAS domain S-box-containing protein